MCNLFLGELHLVHGAKDKNLTPTKNNILTIQFFYIYIYSNKTYMLQFSISNVVIIMYTFFEK